MNFSFIFPLVAAVVMVTLAVSIARMLLRTHLITFLFLEAIPVGFSVWMVDRIFAATLPEYFDLIRVSNVCYILGPMFLVVFVDLISKGRFTWRSLVFTFLGGGLITAAIFVDKYAIGYNPESGWVQVAWETPAFYMILYMFVFLVALPVFGGHLVKAFQKNKGANKTLLKRILIIYFASVLGTFIFTTLRTLRLIDYPFINSADTLFMALGFGYLSLQYLRHPYLFHLDLLDVQLYGLYIYSNSGILLYSYEFQSHGNKESKDLISGALVGVESLFKEILSSDQTLREIRQEANILLLDKGEQITVGFETNLATFVTRNWVYRMRMEFEKQFADQINVFLARGQLCFNDGPDAIVKSIFFP